MKKTFTINISGSIFHIDEDAYEKLQVYLRSINAHYGVSEEGREIIADIESRISEIFNEKLSSKDQVVTEIMIDEVITIMGKPEEIFETDSEDEEEVIGTRKTSRRRRRLFRDPDHRVFGGVASGISAYFGIDVVVIRLIFVLLFFLGYGFSFLLYIILWIVVPKANTTAQKLEMKGERVNISNIEKSIKDEYQEVKENFDNMREKRGPQVRDGFDKGVDFAGSALRLVLKIVLIVLGLGLIITGFFALLSFLASVIFTTTMIGGPFSVLEMPGMMVPEMFFTGIGIKLFSLGLILVIGIPLVMLMFVGIKLLVKFKTNNKAIGLTALALWLGGIILMISVGLTQAKSYISSGTTYADTEVLDTFETNTLYIRAEKNIDFDWRDAADIDGVKVIVKDDEKLVLGEPTLDIEISDSGNYEIIMKKKSRGRTHGDAVENADEIKYSWKQVDSLLIFDEYFTLPIGDKWRNQKLQITLKVPEGKAVYLDKSVDDIIHDIDNVSNTWDGDMVGKKWIMKQEGLTLYRD